MCGGWQVNYVLVAVTLGLLMFVCRSDRRLVAVLLSWACTLYILLLVDEFALWYIALLVDLAVYWLLYGNNQQPSTTEDADRDEQEDEREENDEVDGDGEEEDVGGGGSFDEQHFDGATKSQPNSFRGSEKRASVMLTKLQL